MGNHTQFVIHWSVTDCWMLCDLGVGDLNRYYPHMELQRATCKYWTFVSLWNIATLGRRGQGLPPPSFGRTSQCSSRENAALALEQVEIVFQGHTPISPPSEVPAAEFLFWSFYFLVLDVIGMHRKKLNLSCRTSNRVTPSKLRASTDTTSSYGLERNILWMHQWRIIVEVNEAVP